MCCCGIANPLTVPAAPSMHDLIARLTGRTPIVIDPVTLLSGVLQAQAEACRSPINHEVLGIVANWTKGCSPFGSTAETPRPMLAQSRAGGSLELKLSAFGAR